MPSYYRRTKDTKTTELPVLVDVELSDILYIVRKIKGTEDAFTSNQTTVKDIVRLAKGNGTGNGGGVLIGSGVPDPGLGAVDDSYIDTDTSDLYLKTDKGWGVVGNLRGATGIQGTGLTVLGTLNSTNELPKENMHAGDTWIINRQMYVWDTEKWSEVGQRGPKGKSNYEIAVDYGYSGTEEEWLLTQKGDQGKQGERGLKGDKGDPSIPFYIKDVLENPTQLPPDGDLTGCYAIDRHVWIWSPTNNKWVDLGEIIGPQGKQGEIGPRGFKGDPGFTGKQGEEGKEGKQGPVGPDIYQVAQEEGFQGTRKEFLASLVGPQGQGLTLKDELRSHSDLPLPTGDAVVLDTTYYGTLGFGSSSGGDIPETKPVLAGPQNGDAYLIPGTDPETGLPCKDVWGWNGEKWLNFGPFRGRKGEKGDQGIQGVIGPRGFVGAPIKLLGKQESEEALKAIENPTIGDGYQIVRDIWVYNGNEWINYGPFEGPRGTGIIPKGELSAISDLYLVPDPQDGYYYHINKVGYMYYKGDWINMGDVGGVPGESALQLIQAQNPEVTTVEKMIEALTGDPGKDGKPGENGVSLIVGSPMANLESLQALPNPALNELHMVGEGALYVYQPNGWTYFGTVKGKQGDVGPMGPAILIKGKRSSQANLPSTGEPGDAYIIGMDVWVWAGDSYENMGNVVGPKGDQGEEGPVGPIGPRGLTGKQGEVGTLWLVFDRNPNAVDGRKGDLFLNTISLEYFRKSTEVLWTSQGYLGGANRKIYSLERYDLAIFDSTGDIDLSRFQFARIRMNVDREIRFLKAPKGQAMVIAIIFNGNTGLVKWPDNIKWNNATSPGLGKDSTVVVLLYDGLGNYYGNTNVFID